MVIDGRNMRILEDLIGKNDDFLGFGSKHGEFMVIEVNTIYMWILTMKQSDSAMQNLDD